MTQRWHNQPASPRAQRLFDALSTGGLGSLSPEQQAERIVWGDVELYTQGIKDDPPDLNMLRHMRPQEVAEFVSEAQRHAKSVKQVPPPAYATNQQQPQPQPQVVQQQPIPLPGPLGRGTLLFEKLMKALVR
jgi:hypothetical protein